MTTNLPAPHHTTAPQGGGGEPSLSPFRGDPKGRQVGGGFVHSRTWRSSPSLWPRMRNIQQIWARTRPMTTKPSSSDLRAGTLPPMTTERPPHHSPTGGQGAEPYPWGSAQDRSSNLGAHAPNDDHALQLRAWSANLAAAKHPAPNHSPTEGRGGTLTLGGRWRKSAKTFVNVGRARPQ